MTEEERRRKAAAAARQAKYRERLKERAEAHRSGDHSKCRPGQCDALPVEQVVTEDDAGDLGEPGGDAGEGVTRDVTRALKKSVSEWPVPANLGPRGQRLWDELGALKLGPTHVLVLERACRMADRLARLDSLLEGGDWLEGVVQRVADDGVVEVRVKVDRALGETRQHENVLKLLVAELRNAVRPVAAPPGSAPATVPTGMPQEVADDDDDESGAKRAGNVTNISGILGR